MTPLHDAPDRLLVGNSNSANRRARQLLAWLDETGHRATLWDLEVERAIRRGRPAPVLRLPTAPRR